MTALLRTLLSLALSGSVLILLLLLLLPRLRTRTSRRWQYYIWLAAVLRLLVPFAPEASLMNQLFAPPAAMSQIGSLPEEDSAAPVLPNGRNRPLTAKPPSPELTLCRRKMPGRARPPAALPLRTRTGTPLPEPRIIRGLALRAG